MATLPTTEDLYKELQDTFEPDTAKIIEECAMEFQKDMAMALIVLSAQDTGVKIRCLEFLAKCFRIQVAHLESVIAKHRDI